MTSINQKLWLLILPVLAWFYIGLFATMWFWYPNGITIQLWQEHVINFSVVYIIWLLLFFVYTLFDQATFRSASVFIPRFFAAILSCLMVAVLYFYFQPELLLTPRRFLLVHGLITFAGISIWYVDLFKFKQQGVEFLEHPEFYELIQRRVSLVDLNEIWFLRSVNYRQRVFDLIKRIIDIIVAIVGLILLVIVLPFVAGLIKATSRGQIFFIQSRVGQFGNPFYVYKFRTMTLSEGNTWTAEKDSRITGVGKVLRKLRIDELPQFINIFLGNMSLVGPRPEQVHIVEDLKTQIPYYNERHMVKPGLTGWSQLHVYANSVEGSKLKLQYDLYYIKNRSFLFDVEVILKTIYYIFTWQGR